MAGMLSFCKMHYLLKNSRLDNVVRLHRSVHVFVPLHGRDFAKLSRFGIEALRWTSEYTQALR
jgi:hypothetical protein